MKPRIDDGPDHRAGGRHEPGSLGPRNQSDGAEYRKAERSRTTPSGTVVEKHARTDARRRMGKYLRLAGIQPPGSNAVWDWDIVDSGHELEGAHGVGGPVSGVAGFELSEYPDWYQYRQRKCA